MADNSNDETNFPRKLLLTNTQVSKICKVLRAGLEVPGIISRIKAGKHISNFLLYAGCSIANNKIDLRLSTIFRVINVNKQWDKRYESD